MAETMSSVPDEIPQGQEAPIFEVMRTMRAMRRLKPDPVPRELLERIVQAATWAPSASNTQAYTYVVVTDRGQMRALAEPWRACVDFYQRTAVPPAGMDRGRFDRMLAASRHQAERFAEVPALVVPCYELGPWQRQVERNVAGVTRGLAGLGWRRSLALIRNSRRAVAITEAGCVFPGAQNLLLAARAHGLGAVLTTWHLEQEQEFKSILGIPRRVKTFCMIPLGWPTGRFGEVSRRPAAEVIRYDRWFPGAV
ncbi:MAG TPA: nitroreductase family protein [Solirubrobacteraceae bacterium]|nr:nitroreductase family protein [Solirubrobacteraceae bacterium]